MKTEYFSKVIDDDGQTVMLFPEALLNALKLVPNEILKWTIDGDTIIINRTKYIDNKNNGE